MKTNKPGPSRRFNAWGIFGLALGARLAVVAWAHDRFPPVTDGLYYDLLARRLAEGRGYTWLWPDGAVTYAAHYPVGYPALLAAAYAVFGASWAAAMTVNAVVGAASASAVYCLVGERGGGPAPAPWRAVTAGLVVALHPALVPYTAAIMTEGVTASLLALAAAAAGRAREGAGRTGWLLATGGVLGLSVLVRPQSLVLAPLLGALTLPPPHVRARTAAAPAGGGGPALSRGVFRTGLSRRVARAAFVTAVALAVVAPWTARNCLRIHRCALVSVNGGWNLLIGATSTTGGWQPVAVPPSCATVWDEAAKDACFERAAWERIRSAPWAYISRAPQKLAMTFDYLGAAPSYLHESNWRDFDERAKARLGALETTACRLCLLGALVSSALWPGRFAVGRKGVALSGAIGTLTIHAFLGYLAVAVCVFLAGRRAWVRAPLVLPFGAGVIAATLAVHAAFFGAGRYGLVVLPFVAAVALIAPPPIVLETSPEGP